jgi:hypothetical protein
MARKNIDKEIWGQNGRQRPEAESDTLARKTLRGLLGSNQSNPKGTGKDGGQKKSGSKGGILSGNVLYSDSVRRHYPFAIYCCVLILIYMGFIFAGHRIQREEITCRIELQRLRSKSLILSTERLDAVSHDRLIEEIERRGLKLKQHNTPPMVIGNNE